MADVLIPLPFRLAIKFGARSLAMHSLCDRQTPDGHIQDKKSVDLHTLLFCLLLRSAELVEVDPWLKKTSATGEVAVHGKSCWVKAILSSATACQYDNL